jgi:CheY-like chemotaxis protein
MESHKKVNKQMSPSTLIGQNAHDLFPDLFQRDSVKESALQIAIPSPPDNSWLKNAKYEAQRQPANDALLALLVISDGTQRELIEQKLAVMGYAITVETLETQAIDRLRTKNYHLIFCGAEDAYKTVRQYVNQLASNRRRTTYFVLVGSNLHTFNNLEALALSANLVINTRDLFSLDQILKKGFHDYERLFRPLLDILG